MICWESNEKNYTSGNRQWNIKPSEFNSDEVWSIGDNYEVLGAEVAKYRALADGETAGTQGGQVSASALKKLNDIINEAQGVIDAQKLNVNLTHTYIYYMERAWKAVQDSRVAGPGTKTIDFDAEGNFHLFKTADGASTATAAANFSANDDSPWGFYRYTPSDGAYTKFTTFDTNNSKAKAANGNAWYTNSVYTIELVK